MSASSFGENTFEDVEFDMEGGSYIRMDNQKTETEKANQIHFSEDNISKNDD